MFEYSRLENALSKNICPLDGDMIVEDEPPIELLNQPQNLHKGVFATATVRDCFTQTLCDDCRACFGVEIGVSPCTLMM